MNLRFYKSYFHDGSIVFIKQKENTIEIWMESSEILPEDDLSVPLSNTKRIAGKMILQDVKKIVKDDELIDKVSQDFDDAEILEFDIQDDHIDLSILLYKNNQPQETMNYSRLIIYADKIEWVNTPNLLDSF